MSIIDRRELEFDEAALLKAVGSSPKMAELLGQPGLTPHSVQFHPDREAIAFTYDRGRVVEMPVNTLGALIVSYCVRAKIPLSKTAAKSIQVTPNSVVMSFTTTIDKSPEAGSSPVQAAAALSWLLG